MHWRNDKDRWGAVAMIFHWLTALAVTGLFTLGLWMTDLSYYDSWYHRAPTLHKGIGVLLFLATLARLGWRLVSRKPQELANHAPWERLAAHLTHLALYLLLFAVMASGYLIATADGRPLEVFGWFAIPATLHGLEGQEDIAGTVHLVLASVLILLALGHAGAALKHHFIDRDRTLLRMLGR